jgi:hypothetical protein
MNIEQSVKGLKGTRKSFLNVIVNARLIEFYLKSKITQILSKRPTKTDSREIITVSDQ